MKAPENCRNIEDVREAIDALDREIISLIGRRAKYVEKAATFKTSKESVRAPNRQEKMLRERRRWVEEENLSPDAIEKIYQNLVAYFVNREMGDWKEKGG